MFVGVLVREQAVVPPARIRKVYGALYEVVWLLRYSDTNMAPRHENFPTPTELFFHTTLLEFALVSENAIKKFCPLGPNTWKIFGWGGAGHYFSV